MLNARRTTIFLPTFSLIWLTHRTICKIAKKAGFHGLEIFISNWNKNKLQKLARQAFEHGLMTSYHLPWSLEQNSTHFINSVLSIIGFLPPNGYKPSELCTDVHGGLDVVHYADEIVEGAGTPGNHYQKVFQTCSLFENGEYKISWKDFLEIVRSGCFPVVLDVQHVLEFMLNIKGVEGLKKYTQTELLHLLIFAWDQIGGEKITEIHWVDCNPSLGHTLGRNVWPGKGVLPLTEFADFIIGRGWNGRVVPEVRQDLLFSESTKKLKLLRETVGDHFMC